jgi:hypothetical protein
MNVISGNLYHKFCSADDQRYLYIAGHDVGNGSGSASCNDAPAKRLEDTP